MGHRLESMQRLPAVKALVDFALELVARNEMAGDESGLESMGGWHSVLAVVFLVCRAESCCVPCLSVTEGTGCLMTRPTTLDEYMSLVGNGSLQPAVDDGPKPADASIGSAVLSSFSSVEAVTFTELHDCKQALQYRELK
jgi:hypothetical protein